MKLRHLTAVAAFLGCLGIAAASHAAVVFQDDLENTTTPLPRKPDAPQAGAWVAGTGLGLSSVVSAGGSEPTTPSGGSNLLKLSAKQRNYGEFSTAATAGQVVRIELDAMLSSSSDLNFGLFGDQGTTSLDSLHQPIWVSLKSNGEVSVYQSSPTAKWTPISGLSHTVASWQHYVLEYTVGESTFTLKAGANQSGAISVNAAAAPSEITHVFIQGGTNSTLGYIDNITATVVPEPAGAMVLSLGAMAMLKRRR